jgi:26S proteasome regulatory subunit N7
MNDVCHANGHLFVIDVKDAALAQYRICLDKAVGVGARLDNVFAELRIALFFHSTSHDLIQRTIEVARKLIDEGGDWDRRNRLKVYEGVYLLSIRDFKAGSKYLMDALATFTSTEVMEFKEFVKYTCLAAAVAVPRSEFKVCRMRIRRRVVSRQQIVLVLFCRR